MSLLMLLTIHKRAKSERYRIINENKCYTTCDSEKTTPHQRSSYANFNRRNERDILTSKNKNGRALDVRSYTEHHQQRHNPTKHTVRNVKVVFTC